jgi:hypothetical protein
MADNLLSLAEMIDGLKEEIKLAMKTDNTMFQLGDVTIKTQVAISSKDKLGGKVSFYVVTAELGAEGQSLQSHEISIVLKPQKKLYMGSRKR